MGERPADLFAAGDDDAAGIENPEAGQRDLLCLQMIGISRVPIST